MAGKRGSAYLNLGEETSLKGAPTATIKAEFARRLQRAMIDKGWNQSELARRAQEHLTEGRLGRDNVSQYIRGMVLPGPANLHALAEALDVKPADLVPARAIPSAADQAPPFEAKDLGDGNVWLRVNQAVDKRVAHKIMGLLLGAEK